MPVGLLFGCKFFPKPKRTFRYRDLEPCTLARDTGLSDGNPGDRQNLTGEKKAKPGIFPEAAFENTCFVFRRYSDPIISNDDRKPCAGRISRYADTGNCAVLSCIIKQVIEDLAQEQIGIYFQGVIGNFKGNDIGCQLQ